MKKILQMDPEFKRLSVPLSSEEELKLEKSLIREGCLEPISVWHGCILDGHKRYEICSYEEIEFEIREMDFATREEAIIWACSQRVEKLNHPCPIYKYLVGKWYRAEKQLAHQKRKKENRKTLDLEIETRDETGRMVRTPVDRVSIVVAQKVSRTRSAIEKYGSLSKLYDEIAEKDTALFDAIMSGRISVTFKDHVGRVSVKAIIRAAKERRPGALGYAEAMILEYNKKSKYRLSLRTLYGGKPVNSEDEFMEE